MKRTLQIANGVSLVFTIIFNYVSNTGVFDGKTIGKVSDQYHNLFTPAGYAFSIWGLIYLLMLGFVIYTGRSFFTKDTTEADGFVEKIGWWFVISCVANCLWIVTWLYGYTGLSVVILAVLLVALLIILLTALQSKRNAAEKWLINIPFQIYSGWISVALIAAAASWLQKIGWDGWGLSEVTWTVIMISVAVLVHLYMTWIKNAPFFALVAVWALIAIAVSNQSENLTVYAVAIGAAAVVLVSCVLHFIRKKAKLQTV